MNLKKKYCFNMFKKKSLMLTILGHMEQKNYLFVYLVASL